MDKLFLKIGLVLIVVVTTYTNSYAQDKVKEAQKKTLSLPSFQTNTDLQQPINKEYQVSPFDKYDATRSDFNNSNNYGAKSSFSSSTSSATNTDIGTPANSPFQLGTDISGTIQNSINQITGKLAFSVPLATIASGSTSYALNLGYDGQSSFKTATQLNKYSPTSVVGVGWSLPIPKIVVDNKQTATRDDDEFFIIDGATNSKLICINRGDYVWEFQSEKYAPWVIKYHLGFSQYDSTANPPEFIFRETDFWEITKDNGNTYYFGFANNPDTNYTFPPIATPPNSSSNAKEYISTWGNWIGDSNQSPTGVSTIVWNLSKIRDQWDNFIDFKYELVEGRQNTSQINYKHTEASYLKEIISSKGAKLVLNYGFKDLFGEEHYEPHREKSEPDAYQERYEKKFLQGVEVFNNHNEIVTSYNLSYNLTTLSTGNKKRYLSSITQSSHSNGQSYSLPSQIFEYHTSGTFNGGLKKITYPSGGSVTYNYQNKYLFSNSANRFKNWPSWPQDYSFYGVLVRDNYALFAMISTNPISGDKHRYKFFRYWWNGQQWESDEFTFPHLMNSDMDGFASVLESDFYGFMYDAGQHLDVFLFHKQNDGTSWDYYLHNGLYIADDGAPTFMSGTNFASVGTHHNGNVFSYVWNGSTWNYKQIYQGGGQYYYAATNNFILSLDEDGGADMITGVGHEDNYYIHYLDAEHQWQTKSWSAFADPRIAGIELPSRFYPGNSIAGFVADDNPELFLRWDKDYDLIAVDNVIGAYNDGHYFVPINNSMFTLVWPWYNEPTKTARFNGVNWSESTFSSSINRYRINFGQDIMTYKNQSSNQVMYKEYSPNYHSWVENNLNYEYYNSIYASNAINTEFIVAGNKIFKKTYLGPPSFPIADIGTLQYNNEFSYSDGLSHTFVKQHDNTGFKKGSYFYVDKETGALNEIDLGLKYYLRGRNKLGGNTPFMSPKAMWVKSDGSGSSINPYLYRILNDEFNQSIYDIVIQSIDLDDDNGNVRKINYTYNNPNSLPDNNATYYGEVIVENKGFGTGSIGKVKKIFNNGADDLQMVGLQLEEHILDTNNNLKRKTTNTWEKYLKTANNSSFQVGLSYYLGIKDKKEEIYFDSQIIENLTNYLYNGKGQISSTFSTNSNGEIERQDIKYAHEQYTYVNDKNILTDTYETITKLNNEIVDIKRNVWQNDSGNVYIKEKWSGPSLYELRLNSELTVVDSNGNLLETSDGKDNYNSILNGYSNLYEVASVVNARHQEVIDELDVTYNQLQNLGTQDLKIELMKLYDRLPQAMIILTFYDNDGRVINRVNERKEESFIYYDPYGRVDYITDGYGKVIEKKEYNFGN